MAITVTLTGSGAYSASSNPQISSLAVPADTTAIILLYTGYPNSPGTGGLASASWSLGGGESFTSAHEVVNNSNCTSGIMYLANPTTGTGNITVTRDSGFQEVHIWAICIKGCDTSSMVGNTGSTTGTSSNSDGITMALTVASGAMAFMAGCTYNSEAWSSPQQTSLYQNNRSGITTDDGGQYGAGSGGSLNIGWPSSGVDGADYAGASVEIAAAAAGGGNVPEFMHHRQQQRQS